MSNATIIKLNAQLSAAFSGYVSKHPSVLKGVPKDACIVFTTTANQDLNKINEKLARQIIKREKAQCFVAKKSARGWSVSRMK